MRTKSATVKEILKELDLPNLKRICNQCNISSESKRCIPLREALTQFEWTPAKKEALEEVYISMKKNSAIISSTVHIFRSEDITAKSNEEIKDMLDNQPINVNDNNEITQSGFEDISQNGDEINATFKGQEWRSTIINGRVWREPRTISIPFSILKSEGIVLIKDRNSKDVRFFREFLQETLDINRLHYAIPDGIKEQGADYRDFNGRARDFISALNVEEVNGVFFKVGDNTRITEIDFKGKGDILQERKVRRTISEGGLINGIRGFLRYQQIMVKFEIKWGWFARMHIYGKNISSGLLEEIIKRVYSAYMEHVLR